jgi:putative exporter of polyketide antibiotics
MGAMADLFADNWPAVLIALAVLMVVLGLVRKVVKLAFLGAAVGVIGLFLWPLIASTAS